MKKFLLFSIVVIALLALVAVGTAGQEPEEDIGPAEGEEGVEAGDISIMAFPAKTMNYQGYLTDGSGNPLDGNYNMVFSLWDAETAGTREWGDETHTGVSVSSGVFSVALGETVPLDPYTDFDEQLYLEITVSGTTLPRQMLRAVPYAMGLTAGAQVRGSTDLDDQYALFVSSENGRGIYANGIGNDTYSLFSADITYSSDGYAGPDTYVLVPTLNALLPYGASGEHLAPQENHMRIAADSAGTATVRIPIQIERPYGRSYLLDSARVYYSVSEATITWAGIMGIDLSDGTQPTIGSNSTDYSSTTFSSFLIQATNDYTVTTTMAPASIVLNITMGSSFGSVDLYGVRLQLSSDY